MYIICNMITKNNSNKQKKKIGSRLHRQTFYAGLLAPEAQFLSRLQAGSRKKNTKSVICNSVRPVSPSIVKLDTTQKLRLIIFQIQSAPNPPTETRAPHNLSELGWKLAPNNSNYEYLTTSISLRVWFEP